MRADAVILLKKLTQKTNIFHSNRKIEALKFRILKNICTLKKRVWYSYQMLNEIVPIKNVQLI